MHNNRKEMCSTCFRSRGICCDALPERHRGIERERERERERGREMNFQHFVASDCVDMETEFSL
jgi:hypothetical protein